MAEGGIIESITCINFMCHEHLHVELGPLINFVVGENGSGKSAVLTALTLCLGGKASDTNRGGSLKSFVKEGCDQGRLIVKLKNAGPDAYHREIYGNSIIVERHFSKTGTSGFKIKSETGKVISTKKQEIDEISEQYGLQMSNPLTVLSQDNARQFLNSATPAQKYKYFVSGVQLEQIDNDYKISQDQLDKNLVAREDLTENIAHLKKEMVDAERLAEAARKNRSIREKARLYRNQMAWAQVIVQEKLLEQRELEIQKRTQNIEEAKEELEQMSKALENADDKMTRVLGEKDALIQQRETFDEKVNMARDIYQAIKKELTDTHFEEREIKGKLQAAIGQVRECEAKIQEEEHRLDESTGSARAAKDAELAEANSKERQLKEEIENNTQQGPILQNRFSEAQEGVRRLQRAVRSKRDEILGAENDMKQIEKSTGDAYDGYDQNMMDIVKAINNDREFQEKPIGPLGAHIRLLKPEWSRIIESTLGQALDAFVVTNKKDQVRLSSLMKSVVRKTRTPPIFLAYGGRIDTRAQEPDAQYDTIMRVLRFEDDLVRSQLIINNSIEKIILIRDRVEAEEVMFKNTPRNAAACICFHDGKPGHGIRITSRGAAKAQSTIVPLRQRPRMQSDSGSQVEMQKTLLNQLSAELRELDREARQAGQAQQRCKSELEKLEKDRKTLGDQLRRTQAQIETVQMELDAFEGVDDRLNNLRAELEEKRAEKERLGEQYGQTTLAKQDLVPKSEDAKRQLDEAKGEMREFQSRVDKSDEDIKAIKALRQIAVAKKNAAYERVDSEKIELRRQMEKRDRQAENAAQFERDASAICPDRVHVPDGETYDSIIVKYKKLQEQLAQRAARQGASDEDILKRADEAKKRYKDIIEETKEVDATIQVLKSSIQIRLHIWRQFQRQISARVRIQFAYLLSERGYRGKIDLDHRKRQVILHVEPDNTRQSSTGRNTKTLSGGEKSFSSICMLLSVWEAIGSPIRCLDEFDVFMDNVNRAISTNMLVSSRNYNAFSCARYDEAHAVDTRSRLRDVRCRVSTSSSPPTR